MSATATILLVDDDDLVRDVVRRALERDGYAVLPAGSGPEALRLAGSHRGRIDLVLTDVAMPGMHGVELVARLAARGMSARVLYMSGHLAEDDLGDPLLEKPFSLDSLARAVRHALAEPRAA